MKSFFKKIALVLVLAMVVTMLPAKPAAAANAANGVVMRTKMNLYVEGSDAATGDWKDTGYAWVKNQNGTGKVSDTYNVSFVSENPEIATVKSKTGLVKAVAVGKTTVTATFTPKNGDGAFSLSCTVNVKKNAAAIRLSEKREEQFKEGIKVGFTLPYLTVWREDANGVGGWNKAGSGITDGIRFESDNAEVLAVDFETGKLEALKEGEAKLTMYTVQSEGATKGEDGKYVYPKTGASKSYDVKVVAGNLASARQVTYNTVAITCDTETVAAEIAKDMTKLTAKYVLDGNEIVTAVKSIAVDSSDKAVINVTLHDNLMKDVAYKFVYGNGEPVSVVGADLAAIDHISIITTRVPVDTPTKIEVKFYDKNGIEVPQGDNLLYFTADDSADYMLSGSGSDTTISFYEIGKSAVVTAHYSMGYDNEGKELPEKTHVQRIVSDATSVVGDVVGWAVHPNSSQKASDLGYGKDPVKLAVGDERQLFVKFDSKKFDGSSDPKYNTSGDEGQVSGETYEYASTNDNIVMVDSVTGRVTPVAAGTAQIIVYRVAGSSRVSICVVTFNIAASRVLTSFTASINNQKLSNSPEDSVVLTLTIKDQFGDVLKLGEDLDYTIGFVEGSNVNPVSESGVAQDGAPAYVDWKGATDVKFIGTGVTSTSAKNVRIRVTLKDKNNVEMSRTVTFATKAAGTKESYILSTNRGSIDLNFPSFGWWDNFGKYESVVTLRAYDKDGYLVCTEPMTLIPFDTTDNIKKNNPAGFYYVVTKGSVDARTYVTDNPSAGGTFKAVSGSAEVVEKIGVNYHSYDGNGNAVSSIYGNRTATGTGTYTIRAYQVTEDKDGNKAIKSVTSSPQHIVISDTTAVTAVEVKSNKISSLSLADLKENNFNFRRSGNTLDKKNIEIRDIKTRNVAGNTSAVFIDSIIVRETYYHNGGNFSYDYVIRVGQTFYYE